MLENAIEKASDRTTPNSTGNGNNFTISYASVSCILILQVLQGCRVLDLYCDSGETAVKKTFIDGYS